MLRFKLLLCWNNGLLGLPKLFSISFYPLQGIKGTNVGWFSSKWLQKLWLCYVILGFVFNKKHSYLMVAWLKVGITPWHHKGRKWGAEPVRKTTHPSIQFHAALVRASCLHLSQQRVVTLPKSPVPQPPKNVMWLNCPSAQFEGKFDAKLQNYLDF